MKKCGMVAFGIICMLAMIGCGRSSGRGSLEEIPDTYSLEQAKKDGCVVHENGDVTAGEEVFETFFHNTKKGKKDTVTLAFYYTLGDSSSYDPDYYESIQDDYPVLYIQDLSFDGKEYTIRWYEEGEEIVRNYLYLLKYEGQAESPTALYQSYVRYVLTNDDAVTWQELMQGMLSSSGDYIDHFSVCTDLIYE